jgi:predicted PurR-regulated permease PerM
MRPALYITVLGVVAAVAGILQLVVPRVLDQTGQLSRQLAQAVHKLTGMLYAHFPGLEGSNQLPDFAHVASNVLGLTTSLTGFLAGVVIIIFVGFYLALNAPLYVNGAISVLPRAHRARGRDLLEDSGLALQWWMLGQVANMVAVGLVTTIGLYLLDIPLALVLGILAGLLTFVPYVGAIASGVPAVLIGFLQGPTQALYVLLLFLAAHVVEGYILAPIVSLKVVHVPPALLLAAEAVWGALFGILGIALAAPLTVVVMIAVEVVYRPLVLHEKGEPNIGPGEPEEG